MTCKKILDGDHPVDELSKFINSNLDYWTVRTYRELALEKVRKEKYTNYPSRMSCLYTSKTLSDAEMWAALFINSNRKVYQIVKLQIDGRTFNGDAYNIFDGTGDEKVNNKNADCYWANKPNRFGKKPLVETLIDGRIEVVEIIKDFS